MSAENKPSRKLQTLKVAAIGSVILGGAAAVTGYTRLPQEISGHDKNEWTRLDGDLFMGGTIVFSAGVITAKEIELYKRRMGL